MKFALAGGGTGGHAYPAMAVGERLRDSFDTELVYYGTDGGPEHGLADSAGIPFRSVPASQVRGRSPWRLGSGIFNLLRGRRRARRVLRDDSPDALFATGGYASAPIGSAARSRHVPMLLFLPDVKPGWAVRYMQRHATTVACSVEASLAFLSPRNTVVTGYPVRRQFTGVTREQGARHFGLDPSVHTLLVAGGSLGAHHVNRVVAAALPRLLDRTQVLHISGRTDASWLERERAPLPDWQRERYHVTGYTDEMAMAMAAADLAITRAGASSLGELPVSGLPAIVLPGGFSDQHANASYLVAQGAAVSLPPGELESLPDVAIELLDDEARLAAMCEAMSALAHPDAAERLASMLREMAQREGAA
ncbi:MAG: glycosyltransferase [Dehalococcoidia bacterium]|jgi:UDP-N-acetylglucosamine--N-acetylmuramyl-(pentapeptide) pyrophosphoryl-undecaprenol N-acetylglucosamine transferase|nr:glycosyltransferase [Dehalococcoidia bacterium]